ncbi:MAG: MFS transporter, partial [Spirochaetota bacterium]|nr:MFS transporter [Spirochaetota bacterium]
FPISIILYGMCFFLFLSYLWSTRIPVKVTEKRAISLSLLAKSMKNRGIILIFLTSFLHIVGMAAYHVFFGVFITDRGYAPGYVGIFTVASVFSEVILFHFSAGILRKFSPYILLSVTFLFTALRWFVLSEYSEFWPVILSQTIHSLSWGLFFIVSINYINHHFKELLRTSGVTLFSTLVFGVGNLLGFFLAGTVSKYYGYSVLFFYCGILSLLTFSISLYLVSKEDSGFRLK